MGMTIPQLELPELVFKTDNHTYWLNGANIPGVSELMKPLSSAMYKTIDQAVLNAAADRGSAVHEAIENFLQYGIEDCDPAFSGYFDAFMAWYKEFHPEVLACEVMVYNKLYRYGGTVDLLVRIKGKLWLIDVKTTAKINHMLTNVQLVAYGQALESHGVLPDHKAVLQLKNDGKYTFRMTEVAEDVEAWTTFGALMTVHNHIQKFKKG